MEAARGRVHLVAELAARVQRGEDHLQRGDVLVLGVQVDGDAPAVVLDRGRAVAVERDLDPARVAGDRLVHRVVDELGQQMVQRPLIGAAHVHAGPAAHRLQPL